MIEASQPWAGSDCSALQPFVVDAGQYPSLSISVPDGAAVWAVKLRFVDPHLLTVLSHSHSSTLRNVTITACHDCNFTTPLCQNANQSSPLDVLWQGDYALRIETSGGTGSTTIDITGR